MFVKQLSQCGIPVNSVLGIISGCKSSP